MNPLCHFMSRIAVHIKPILLAATMLLIICSCSLNTESEGFLYSDCGYENTVIQGVVTNSITREPIPNAEVIVLSVKTEADLICPGSRPIDDVHLITDEQGHFYHELGAYRDDLWEMTVSAPGCDPIHQEYLAPGSFDGGIGTIEGQPIHLFCAVPSPTDSQP